MYGTNKKWKQNIQSMKEAITRQGIVKLHGEQQHSCSHTMQDKNLSRRRGKGNKIHVQLVTLGSEDYAGKEQEVYHELLGLLFDTSSS